MKAKKNIMETAAEILDFYKHRGTGRLDQADAIIVNGVGIIANYPFEGLFTWQTDVEPKSGWFLELWHDDTLAGLLFKLNTLLPPTATISSPILRRYLTSIRIHRLIPLGNLVRNQGQD